jgi:hypothetical protein
MTPVSPLRLPVSVEPAFQLPKLRKRLCTAICPDLTSRDQQF